MNSLTRKMPGAETVRDHDSAHSVKQPDNYMESIRGLLLKNPVLSGLSETSLCDLTRSVWKMKMPPRTIVFQEGDSGENFYIIKSGKVRVYKTGEEGLQIDLAYQNPGECFGELALLTGRPRMRSVETLEETIFLVVGKEDFQRVIEKNPHLSAAFINHITTLLESTDSRLERETEARYRIPALSLADFFVIVLLSLFLGIGFNMTNPSGVKISPMYQHGNGIPELPLEAAVQKIGGNGPLFIDARPSAFFHRERITGAVNLPSALFDVMYMFKLSEMDKDREIIVYGRTLSRFYDQEVAKKLVLYGHQQTKVLEGSIEVWKKRGYPVES